MKNSFFKTLFLALILFFSASGFALANPLLSPPKAVNVVIDGDDDQDPCDNCSKGVWDG